MEQRHNRDLKTDRKYFIVFLLIWVVQMAAAFYFCTQKQGFHEDEYYTYYSTARTNGFYVEDGQWMERDTYRNEFVVLPGEGFQYGLVRLVQSWDVHPPMYYWVFHTVASLVPGVFSKWIGLSVNLFFHGINIILLTYLSFLAGGRDWKLALAVSLFFGLSPAAMSGVVFIRMYEMLTAFVLLCALLHVHTMQKNEKKLSVLKDLIPMAVVTYIGFLTQYYYFIFLFFLAAAFCIWLLWRDKNLWNCLRYGIAQGIAFGLAYLTYPSCLGQMFRGQRGAQATENFFDLSNTLSRVCFFLELLDRYVFGRMLPAFVLLLVLIAVTVYRRDRGRLREQNGATFYMLLFAVAGYFVTVSKTALLLGGTSIRYQLPIYGMAILLLLLLLRTLWKNACISSGKYAQIWAAVCCLAIVLLGHRSGGVVFLYPEDREQTDFAVEQAEEDVPVIYLYQSGEEWCIWDVTNELLAYPQVYFVAAGEADKITDERIQNADRVVVYVAKGIDWEIHKSRIFESAPKLTNCRMVFDEKYCDVYELGGL